MKKIIFAVIALTLTGCVVTAEGPVTGAKYDYNVLNSELTINDAITVEVPR